MKKLLMILIIMTIITMGLSSEDKLPDKQKERLNSYITTFQLQKITYQGVEGFFIPYSGYTQLMLDLNDYIYYQDLLTIKDEKIKQLEKLEITNFQLKTVLGITISFDVGTSLLAAALGIMCYNLAKK